MNKKTLITALFMCSLIIFTTYPAIAQSKEKKMDRYITDLMKKMTIEEKIGQLNLINAEMSVLTGPSINPAGHDRIVNGEIGGLLNVLTKEKVFELQNIAIKESRLGIPLLFGRDIIHGYKTIFPIPLGLSATWNMESIEKMARISAIEGSAEGVNWTFSPMVDISYDARWGRVAEGGGEDPFLASLIAKAYIRGYQGNLSGNDHILACVKHFALYGAPEAGKDYNTVDMSRQRMFEQYLPPFKTAVDAGVGSVMTAFNDVEGVPAGANSWLMKQILREKWGFDGFVVSDWDAVREMTIHGIGDLQEVSSMALTAGLDMDMGSQGFSSTLIKSLEEGIIRIEDIDRACKKILEAKYKLGLFANPYKYCDTTKTKQEVYLPEHRIVARKIATESFVLLKNKNQILPLSKQGTIAVIGPLADNPSNILGTWSIGADSATAVTVLDGIRDAVKGKIDVLYAKGSNLTYDLALEQRVSHWGKRFHRDGRSPIEMTSEALLIAQKADIIIAVMGEGAEMSGEGASRTNLDIPDAQKDLLKELKKLNKPIVLVLCSGRPMTLVWENDNLDAILNIWFPGSEAGNAVADVLFGDAAPGGRLTMTYPRSVGQVPIRYNYRKTGRPPFDSGWIAPYVTGYIDDKHLPLYPFGFGLTYTQFEYSDIKLNRNDMTPNEKIKASVTVQNIGKASGHELVQLYLRDVKCSITRPVKELKGFEKIYLKPGEEKVVEFEIGVDMLRFYNNDLDHIYEAGKFEVLIGTNSETVNSVSFELKSN